MAPASPRIILRPDGEFEVARPAPARERWSWALYDFANTIFSMNIVTLYFSVWLAEDLGARTGGYALATSLSSALVAVSVPVFGLISDQRRRRKAWVVALTLGCVLATAALGVVGQYARGTAAVLPALAIFVIANYAYQGALPFYNAMLPELVPVREQGRLSGYGTALGYVGSIAGMLLIAPFVTGGLPLLGALPEPLLRAIWRIPFAGTPGRAAAFVPTALAFLLCSLPFFLWCRDHLPVPRREWPRLEFVRPFRELAAAVADSRRYPGLLRFVLSSYCYQDALGTVIAFMAVYAVKVMHFANGSEVTLFVVLTIPSILGAAVAGAVSDRIGPKRTLLGVLAGWTALIVAIVLTGTQPVFWLLGGFIGFLFGGIPTTERPMLLTLVPDAESGRYFGVLVLSARAASIVGPLLWWLTVEVLFRHQPPGVSFRIAMGGLAAFMALATWLLAGVPDRHREKLALGAAPPGATG